ncbi:unnamed protein product [Rhizoctonia solani]|uniref:Uncharacterized protein n=1 Tax=Rhizoctonia solani TaxID=456999 RepID=A0A8H3HYT6_9AGAM|nr:unnamed protein product [Rhizoctonia solani]
MGKKFYGVADAFAAATASLGNNIVGSTIYVLQPIAPQIGHLRDSTNNLIRTRRGKHQSVVQAKVIANNDARMVNEANGLNLNHE